MAKKGLGTQLKNSVAIMQPTYLPWIGYFDLMDQVDSFVYLDSVQFAKRSWQQRNRIRTHQGELMLTVPVLSKGAREQTIAEAKMEPGFQKKHLRSIEQNYSKAMHFKEIFPGLQGLYVAEHESLASFNIALIEWMANLLGMKAERKRASEIPHAGQKVDLLLSICKSLGAKEYLSPPGSKVYIDEDNRFPDENIVLRYQAYEPVPYSQIHGKDFLPYMSALDVLMNVGAQGTLDVLRRGRKISE